jgi:hypothetical protein
LKSTRMKIRLLFRERSRMDNFDIETNLLHAFVPMVTALPEFRPRSSVLNPTPRVTTESNEAANRRSAASTWQRGATLVPASDRRTEDLDYRPFFAK